MVKETKALVWILKKRQQVGASSRVPYEQRQENVASARRVPLEPLFQEMC